MVVTVSVAAIIVMLIRINVNIHIDHLNFSLKQQSIIRSDASSINLFARFINQKKLYSQQITRTHFDMDEAFLMFSTAGGFRDEFSNILPEYNAIERATIVMINVLRHLTGKPPLPSEKDMTVATMISYAKYYEQQKKYSHAIAVYDKIIEKNINAGLTSAAILNRALCFAFMGDFTTSKNDLNKIIKNYPADNISVTASVLLMYLNEFSREKELILQSRIKTVEKGRRLSNLLQFELALSILDTITPQSKEMEAKINYYRGISYEELGQTENAIESYIKSIEKGGVSEISKIANRRLFMAGSQFEPQKGEEIRAISKKINTVLGDESLNVIEKFTPKSVIHEENPVDNILEESEPDSIETIVDSGSLIADIIADPENSRLDSIMQTLTQQQAEIQNVDSLEALSLSKQAELEEIPTVLPRKTPPATPKAGDRVIIETKDNRAFIGQILSDLNSPVIRLQTLIGLIGIHSSDVKSIRKMEN